MFKLVKVIKRQQVKTLLFHKSTSGAFVVLTGRVDWSIVGVALHLEETLGAHHVIQFGAVLLHTFLGPFRRSILLLWRVKVKAWELFRIQSILILFIVIIFDSDRPL